MRKKRFEELRKRAIEELEKFIRKHGHNDKAYKLLKFVKSIVVIEVPVVFSSHVTLDLSAFGLELSKTSNGNQRDCECY